HPSARDRDEDGAIVGVYNIGQIFYGPLCSAYLGYYAFEPFAGQGYMREGLRLVLRCAFGPLGLHRLEANRRVPRRSGAQDLGPRTRRDIAFRPLPSDPG
ncbi:MAG: GNAT family N-acetyltransferase, partial [Actinomycetota bacterium]